jgi:cytochrome c55X
MRGTARPWRAAMIASAIAGCALAQDKPDAKAAELGRELYETHCVGCHGPDMVNPGTVSYDLRKFPRDSKDRFARSVLNGKPPGMPAWRGIVAPEEVDLLWSYVLTGGNL